MNTRLRIMLDNEGDDAGFPLLPSSSVKSSLTNTTELSSEDEQRRDESEQEIILTSHRISEVVICQDESLYNLGIEEYEKKQFQRAIEYWCRALKTQGREHYLVLWSLLNLYLELKQMEPGNVSHQRNAMRYFDMLKPHVSKLESPIKKSALVLEYFIARGDWWGAIELAKKMEADASLIARFHYERGIDASSTTLSIDCMSKCLSLEPPTRLVIAAHAELVKLYAKSGNYLQALEHHKKLLGFVKDKEDITKAYYEEGELYLALDEKEKALAAFEKGLEVNASSKFLLQAKADLLFFLGNVDDSIVLYETLTSNAHTPAEQRKYLYAMGRICHKSRRRKCAGEYYKRELQITQESLGLTHLECSRIYHELAKLADEACDYDEALFYLQNALEIEGWNLRQVKDKVQIEFLMRETQKNIGKIYYKKGDFSFALEEVF
mmetsp:Transcript_26280/g.39789  ORF Transcript_26280/g.39789 Transcript_26280/m.39789 type:complete len:437 (-) Transcript_26280:28-1338(-)